MTEKREANDLIEALCEIELGKAEDVWRLFSTLRQRYVFRGQTEAEWGLRTTFERAAEGIKGKDRETLEQTVITEFQRRVHHYLSDLPKEENRLEWLALMQHHGCPTRLLDFTRSFWVGLFFAVENARSDCALWAVSRRYAELDSTALLREDLHPTYVEGAESEANEILSTLGQRQSEAGILLVEPRRMNERLSIQQGLFLFPKNLQVSFEENLCTSWGCKSLSELAGKRGHMMVVKMVVPEELCLRITYLLSTMNISAATLFPGLDGFGRSQMTKIKSAKLTQKEYDEFWRDPKWARLGHRVLARLDKIAESEGRNPEKQQ